MLGILSVGILFFISGINGKIENLCLSFIFLIAGGFGFWIVGIGEILTSIKTNKDLRKFKNDSDW